MPGFMISNKDSNFKLNDKYAKNTIFESMHIGEIYAERNTINKFMNDKCFNSSSSYMAIIEGYLLNKETLFNKYNVHNIFELCKEMYNREGEKFFSAFRGSFSGVFYDIKKELILIFTNQIGDNPVFYAKLDTDYFIGSSTNYILENLYKIKDKTNINESACYQMLTYGYMVNNETYINELKRLTAGEYIKITKENFEVLRYHKFIKETDKYSNLSREELINEIDKTFKKAVELEYNKDREYQYKHLTDISGGLDSRIAMWAEHMRNDTHMNLITYSKSGYLDQTISEDIAKFWKDELLIKTLDDASFLYDIDEIVEAGGGLSLYAGITGGYRMLKQLDLTKFGMEHTGMIGDVVLGSFLWNTKQLDNYTFTGMYSTKLKSKLDEKIENYRKSFNDNELFLIYSRGFQGAGNTSLLRRNFTEIASPFWDVDFLQLCMDIPLDYRVKHKLYKDLVIKKYPDAAKFKWEKINGKITDPSIILLIKKLIYRGPSKLARIFGKDELNKSNMNPLDFWVKNNISLKTYLDEYFMNNVEVVKEYISDELYDDMNKLYNEGNVNEKSMVLTVIASIKYYKGL